MAAVALPAAAGRQTADPAGHSPRRHLPGRRRDDRRVTAPPPHLPGRSPAGLHAHVAGLRLVPADRRGLDRDHGAPGIPPRSAAGTRIFQIFRHGTAPQAGVRLPDGPAAALRPLGRGAGLEQTHPLQGHGHAPHDQTRHGRPHRPLGPVVHLPGPSGSRKRHVRPLRRGGVPDRHDRRMDAPHVRHDGIDECGERGLVVLLLVSGHLLRGHALLALHAHLHGDTPHLPAPLRSAFG